VAEFSSTGTNLVYSTFFGGAGTDWGEALTLDPTGDSFITGRTNSTDFPTHNAYQSTNAGDYDGFVMRLNAAGTTLRYATYLGGSAIEKGYDIVVDGAGITYVAGMTQSPAFPVTANAYQHSYAGGGPCVNGDSAGDAYFAKLDTTTGGTGSLLYATYLGGSGCDSSRGLAVDGGGRATLTGWTDSLNFPLHNPIQGNSGGAEDGFVTRFTASDNSLDYSSYLGGSNNEYGRAILTWGARTYIVGETQSTDFPVVSPYQGSNNGGGYAFIAILQDLPSVTPTSTPSNTPTKTPTTWPTLSAIATALTLPSSTATNTASATVPPALSPSATAGPTQTMTPAHSPTPAVTVGKTTATPGNTPTITPGSNLSPTAVPGTAPPTASLTPTATATACALPFNDVPPDNPFYPFIRCLACRGIVTGYPCGGPGEPCPGAYFRPNRAVTRGQVSKVVAESAALTDPIPSGQQTFADVPPGSTFYLWIERLATRAIISGYPCGGPFEPCVAPDNRPYFRPSNDVTRGQTSKIVSGAAHWTETPTGQTFADVAPGSTFYLFIEQMASRGIIGGYPCGLPGEPCVAPGNRPYFRPNNPATRGQMSKIAAEAFYPQCQTPQGR
jgi:hypothetical protein